MTLIRIVGQNRDLVVQAFSHEPIFILISASQKRLVAKYRSTPNIMAAESFFSG
jgi:hypothetical protein